MTKDDPLAKKKTITPADLVGRTVLHSQQADTMHYFDNWQLQRRRQFHRNGQPKL